MTHFHLCRSTLESAQPEALISLINAHPTADTINDLVNAFEMLSDEHPEKTDLYARALVRAREEGQFPMIPMGDEEYHQLPETFARLLNRLTYEKVSDRLFEPDAQPLIKANDRYIIASIMSGISLRTTMTYSSLQMAQIRWGLHFRGSKYEEHCPSERWEVNAVAACVCVITAGKAIYGGHRLVEEEELKERLNSQEIDQLTTTPMGRKVLKIAREHVESGFEGTFLLADFWNALNT